VRKVIFSFPFTGEENGLFPSPSFEKVILSSFSIGEFVFSFCFAIRIKRRHASLFSSLPLKVEAANRCRSRFPEAQTGRMPSLSPVHIAGAPGQRGSGSLYQSFFLPFPLLSSSRRSSLLLDEEFAIAPSFFSLFGAIASPFFFFLSPLARLHLWPFGRPLSLP